MLAHLLAQHVVCGEHVDGPETLPDAVHLQQGTLQPAPERAPAHRRARPVYVLDQLLQAQVAPRRRVEDHPRARIVRTEGHHLLRRTAATQGSEVLDQGPCCAGERRAPIDPVSFEPGDPEVPLQSLLPRGGLERPARGGAHGGPHLRQPLGRGPLGDDDLTRRPPLQLGGELLLRDLGARELSCRSLDDGYSGQAVPDDERGQVVGLPCQENIVLYDRARRQNAGDLTGELFGFGRVLPLLGDGDGVTLSEEGGQMLLQGVSWNPGQRDAALACRLAARQPDRERLRDPLGILLEGLEERPDLVQENRLRRKLRLQLRVTSKHKAILRPEPRFVSPESHADPGSQDGYHRPNDESKVEQATEHQPSGPQLTAEPEREVEESSRSQGEHHGEEVERGEVPRREKDAECNGYGALEHHCARNVAEGKGVLAFPYPEGGVELLRLFGRQGRQYQSCGGVLDRVNEEVCAPNNDAEARERLEADGKERRLVPARQ